MSALLAGAGCLCWSRAGSAQTVTLTENRIGRRLPDAAVGSAYDYRNARRWWISREDCLNDEIFDFPIAVDRPMDTLEVWAGGGTDCATVRPNQDKQQCWLLQSVPLNSDSLTVSVPVRNIVLRRLNDESVPQNVGPEVCDPEGTDRDGTQVTLYFFVQDNGQVSGTKAVWDASSTDGIGFDLVGPSPPGSISLGMGERQLLVNVKDVSEDNDRERFAAYCQPLDEGAACNTSVLVEGQPPALEFACGEASETSGTIVAKGLENGTTYAVAVAGEDLIGNPGELSNVQCATPQPLDDFFELYTRNGGPGGGGFCDVSSGLGRSSLGATSLLGLALAALGVRRRRQSP